jgi:hypothetical protein
MSLQLLEEHAAKYIYIYVGFWMTHHYMGTIMFGIRVPDVKVPGCTGAFAFFGRGRLKLVVLPLNALMLMESFAEASSDEKVGFKSIVYWLLVIT